MGAKALCTIYTSMMRDSSTMGSGSSMTWRMLIRKLRVVCSSTTLTMTYALTRLVGTGTTSTTMTGTGTPQSMFQAVELFFKFYESVKTSSAFIEISLIIYLIITPHIQLKI